MKQSTQILSIFLIALSTTAISKELSRYMGGPIELITAPNGARVDAELIEVSPMITYNEPTTEKVADGVWCIGGVSLANTTVIEGDDGLIIYDTGDTREEGEHIREAIEKISDKPIICWS